MHERILGKAQGERNRALANGASNATGKSAQTKGCEQRDDRGKSVNNANNMTGRGRAQTMRSMQQCMQTPRASNMTGRGHARTTRQHNRAGDANMRANKAPRATRQEGVHTGQDRTGEDKQKQYAQRNRGTC